MQNINGNEVKKLKKTEVKRKNHLCNIFQGD